MELEKRKYKIKEKLRTYATTMDFHTGRTYRIHRDRQDRGAYGRFIRAYMSAIIREIILGNYHYSIMCGLGVLKVEEYYPYHKDKPIILNNGEEVLNRSGAKVDWPVTKKIWAENPVAKEKKLLKFYTNEHSEGRKIILLWDRRGSIFANKDLYTLNLNCLRKKDLAQAVFAGKRYFISNASENAKARVKFYANLNKIQEENAKRETGIS